MKKNVFLVQPSNVLTGSVYLPYTIAALAAYAWQFDAVREQYALGDFVYKKDPIADVLSRMESPYLVGFSCYMWNIEYNLALAAAVKEKWHDCLIVFGGPQIPDDTEYLHKHDYIDILMHGEGERSFYELLCALQDGLPLDTVANLSYRNGAGFARSEKRLFKDLSQFPSAYASGLLDGIVDDPANSDLEFCTVLETNRGCPYGCIYCTWAATKERFRPFPMERIYADLDWMSRHKIVYCICADSNFGILERDEQITDYIVALKKATGFPIKFETASAKNKTETVFDICKKLESVNMNCGISHAVQSFSPTVLENIGRKNISIPDFKKQISMYRDAGIATYTDLILGLPGETFDSFCHGLFYTIECGQHSAISIHPCEVLPNTALYQKETLQKYHIRTVASTLCQFHSKRTAEDRFGSRSNVIVSTDTLSVSEWRDAMRLATVVQSYHSFGILRFAAVYLRRAQELSYEQFYTSLYQWIETKSVVVKQIIDLVCGPIDTFAQGKGNNLSFYDEQVTDSYLDFKEGLFLYTVLSWDEFWVEMEGFLQPLFKDPRHFDDLIRYQKSIIVRPGIADRFVSLQYDWHKYFENFFELLPAMPKPLKHSLRIPGCGTENLLEYTKNILWHGKRTNKMICKNVDYILQETE